MNIVCAIHQPNFFPWMGYFDKIKRSDIFVFLDDVQHIKSCGSWVNRVKLNCHGLEKWLTCPITRPSGLQKINEVNFANPNWRVSLINVIDNYYSNHKNYAETKKIILEILNSSQDFKILSDFNIHSIQFLANLLGLNTRFIKKSNLNIRTNSTDMLVDVCKAVGADIYLCGGGASGYQEDDKFKLHNINLMYQSYQPEIYGNPKLFIPGLSIIDYLMSY